MLFTTCGIQHFEAILYKAKTADETAKLKLASEIQIILKTAGQQQKSLKSLNNFKQGNHLVPYMIPTEAGSQNVYDRDFEIVFQLNNAQRL